MLQSCQTTIFSKLFKFYNSLSTTQKIWSDINTLKGLYKPTVIDSLSFNNDISHDPVDITNGFCSYTFIDLFDNITDLFKIDNSNLLKFDKFSARI